MHLLKVKAKPKRVMAKRIKYDVESLPVVTEPKLTPNPFLQKDAENTPKFDPKDQTAKPPNIFGNSDDFKKDDPPAAGNKGDQDMFQDVTSTLKFTKRNRTPSRP